MRRQRSITLTLGSLLLVLGGVGLAFAQMSRPNYGPPSLSPFLTGPPPPLTGEAIFERIVYVVLCALVGFVIGAFFSPLLRPVRRLALFGLLALALAYSWFGNSEVAEYLAYPIRILCFFVTLGYGFRLGAAVRARDPDPTSFGTAKWATESYLRDRGLFGGKGFLLGAFASAAGRAPLHYSGARHLLTVAPTRSGKGVASIIPNLLTYEGSAFIIDPKGENAFISAARRGDGDPSRSIPGMGQSVFLVDPWDIAAGNLGRSPARFNPLDWIDADDPDAAENAFLLADALVLANSQGEARFWDDEAKALLTGVILYVATSKNEAANRHLARVRDILLLDGDGFKAVLGKMYNSPLPVVASTASRTAGKDEKLRSNVLAALQSHTHFLDSPRIRESLSASDFRFEDLKSKAMTVYLILPADRLQTFDRWLRLLIQQAITVNARDIAAKPKNPVLFLLDEMASLGRLTMVEQAYGLMAGFGMQLWGIVQDLSQLERIYGQGWQTFISNSGVIQYFGSRDKMTAEYFSTLCGVTTIRIFSWSYAFGRTFAKSSGANSQSSSSNESESHTDTTSSNESQRQLAYPDELMVLKDDMQIVFVENFNPVRASKVRWFEDDNLRKLGVDLLKNPELAARSGPVALTRSSPAAVAPPSPRPPLPASPVAPPSRPATSSPLPAPTPQAFAPPAPAAPEPFPPPTRPAPPKPSRPPQESVARPTPAPAVTNPTPAAAPAFDPNDLMAELEAELSKAEALEKPIFRNPPKPKTNPPPPIARGKVSLPPPIVPAAATPAPEVPRRQKVKELQVDATLYVKYSDGTITAGGRDGTRLLPPMTPEQLIAAGLPEDF
jgi:type IV secretion system protein VirD4